MRVEIADTQGEAGRQEHFSSPQTCGLRYKERKKIERQTQLFIPADMRVEIAPVISPYIMSAQMPIFANLVSSGLLDSLYEP